MVKACGAMYGLHIFDRLGWVPTRNTLLYSGNSLNRSTYIYFGSSVLVDGDGLVFSPKDL